MVAAGSKALSATEKVDKSANQSSYGSGRRYSPAQMGWSLIDIAYMDANLKDATGTSECLQAVDEILEDDLEIRHKLRALPDEKQAMDESVDEDTSDQQHPQSSTREKTVEAAAEEKDLFLKDLAAASEKQQSGEKIIDDEDLEIQQKLRAPLDAKHAKDESIDEHTFNQQSPRSPTRKKTVVAAAEEKGSPLQDLAAASEKQQSDEKIIDGEGLEIQQKLIRASRDEEQALDESIDEDTSDQQHPRSPTRKKTVVAAAEEKGSPLKDLAAASEKQQSDKKIINGEGLEIQQKLIRASRDEEQALNESIDEDNSDQQHPQSSTREKTVEATADENGSSLKVLADASEKQQSDENIIDGLKRMIEECNSDNSKLQVEIEEKYFEDREENLKVNGVMEKIAKFAKPERTSLVEAKLQGSLVSLKKKLLLQQSARTDTHLQNTHLKEQIKGGRDQYLFLDSEFEYFKVESSAEAKVVEVKSSKQDEEIDSLHELWKRMEKLKLKEAEALKSINESLPTIRSIEAKLDCHSERFEVLGHVLGRANESCLKELSACTEELRMEKTKVQSLDIENDALMNENQQRIMLSWEVEMMVLIFHGALLEISEEFRNATRHLSLAIRDYIKEINQFL